MTFDHYTFLGDQAALGEQLYGTQGFIFSDYDTMDFTMQNSDIENAYGGIVLPTRTHGIQTIRNTFLWNANDITWPTMWSVDADCRGSRTQTDIILDNDTFGTGLLPGSSSPPTAIVADYAPNPGTNIVQLDQLFVKSFNGVPGQDFQVFYAQQTAGTIVPQTQFYPGTNDPDPLGVPVAGLTNQQAMSQYGLAIAGQIAPASATTLAGITGGLVSPFSFNDTWPTVSVTAPASITLPSTMPLVATITTSGQPPSVQWLMAFGTGTATFTDPTAAVTSASFSAPGLYLLRVIVSDGVLSSSADAMVTVNDSVGSSSAPTITTINDLSVVAGTSSEPVFFTIAEQGAALSSLSVSATSSVPGVIPLGDILLGGSNGSRSVAFNAGSAVSGSSVITLTVSDGTLTASTSFTLTVVASSATGTGTGGTSGSTGTGTGSGTATGTGTGAGTRTASTSGSGNGSLTATGTSGASGGGTAAAGGSGSGGSSSSRCGTGGGLGLLLVLALAVTRLPRQRARAHRSPGAGSTSP